MSKNREKKIRKIIFCSDLSETMAKNQGKKIRKIIFGSDLSETNNDYSC